VVKAQSKVEQQQVRVAKKPLKFEELPTFVALAYLTSPQKLRIIPKNDLFLNDLYQLSQKKGVIDLF